MTTSEERTSAETSKQQVNCTERSLIDCAVPLDVSWGTKQHTSVLEQILGGMGATKLSDWPLGKSVVGNTRTSSIQLCRVLCIVDRDGKFS